jgi:hypothetical protein
MGRLRNFGFFNHLVLSSALLTFTVTSIPVPCHSQINVTADDVLFGYRMEQIVEKLFKAIKKENADKAIDLMLDAKREIEAYSGQYIDLDQKLNEIENEIKKEGAKIPKKEFGALRKMLKKREKRANHRAFYMEYCFQEGITYEPLEEEALYMAKNGQEDGEEIIIPIRLIVGVSAALVGVFIVVVPVIPPPIKPYGTRLMGSGLMMALDACYDCYDERQRQKQK